jgi:hypothetical protein
MSRDRQPRKIDSRPRGAVRKLPTSGESPASSFQTTEKELLNPRWKTVGSSPERLVQVKLKKRENQFIKKTFKEQSHLPRTGT